MDIGASWRSVMLSSIEVALDGGGPVIPVDPGVAVLVRLVAGSGVIGSDGVEIPGVAEREAAGIYVGLVPYPGRFKALINRENGAVRVVLGRGPGFWVPSEGRVCLEGEVARWRLAEAMDDGKTNVAPKLTSIDGGNA